MNRLLESTLSLVLIAALVVFVLMRLEGQHKESEAAYAKIVKYENERADAVQARFDSAAEYGAAQEKAAEQERARRAALEAETQRLAARASRLEQRIASLPVPPEIEVYTAPRDSLIAVQREQIAKQAEAIAAEKAAYEALHLAYTTVLDAARELSTTVNTLQKTLDERPKDKWYRPVCTVGGHAGVNALDGNSLSAGPSVNCGLRVSF